MSRGGLASLSVCHGAWYAAAALASLLFLLLMPPLQTNDEDEHFGRVWSVAFGGPVCRTAPAVGRQLPKVVDYNLVRARRHAYRMANLDAANDVRGSADRTRAWGACYYSPLAYLLPAAAMRLVATPTDPTRSAGLVPAFYAARLVNWLLMAAGVFAFLVLVPELRNLTLVLYSLPMVMQQTISINQDSAIFCLMFALLFFWFRPASVAQLVALALVITGLTLLKVVYAVLLLMWLCAWLRLRAAPTARPRPRTQWALLALLLAPIVAQLAWSRINAGARPLLPYWASIDGQLASLRAHPQLLVRALVHQLGDFFGRGEMNGGWPGIFGILGYAEHAIGDRAYHALAAAVAIALVADGVHAPRALPPGRLWIDRLLPIAAALGVIGATVIAMYFVFTRVGADYVTGVQGRYLHAPLFILLAVALAWVQARWQRSRAVAALAYGAPVLPWIAFSLCGVGVLEAFATLRRVYY